MKKFFAAALSLVLALAVFCCAGAEMDIYQMTAVTDLEGNEVPADELPVLVFGIDTDTMECAFGTVDGTNAGTAEETAEEDGAVICTVTINGETILMEYTAEQDCFTYVDEELGLIFCLTRMGA